MKPPPIRDQSESSQISQSQGFFSKLLGVRVGDGCAGLHDRMMRDLHINLLEFDEVWSFIGKKQKRLGPDDLREKGDCYIFTALSATHKAIVSYKIGKRSGANANAFAMDVRQRILGRPQI